MEPDATPLRRFPPTFWLTLILLLGFTLRLYELGRDSLWNDEVGVALAVQANTFGEMLRMAHNHVMAMPLDYAVVWLFARLNASEVFLRLPAALWGSLTIVIAFGLFSRLANQRVGLLSALLLALSPFHVQYSQELRFYAALTFFFLAAMWALLVAIDKPSPANWRKFILIAIIGILFHVYVLLVLVSGAVWLLIGPWKGTQRSSRRIGFIRSASVVLIAFLAGVVIFGGVYSYDIPLVLEDPSISAVIATGLGWAPFYPASSNAVLTWGIGCAGLEAVAVAGLLIRRPRSASAAMFYALLIQVGIIIVMNVLKHYFIAPRQFITFIPILLFFAADGLDRAISAGTAWLTSRQSGRPSASLPFVLTALACLLVILAGAPALIDYYRGDKGEARSIGQFLLQNAQPADRILVIPDFESQMVDYYLDDLAKPAPVDLQVYGARWDQLTSLAPDQGKDYLIAKSSLTPVENELTASLGYRPVFQAGSASRYARTIWVNQ